MRGSWKWLLVGSVALCSCAGEDAADSSGVQQPDYGGQTGSLLPPGQCQVPAATRGELVVAEGNVAFVARASSLETPQATLIDDSGRAIELEFDELENGSASAAISNEALTPGTYQVEYACEGSQGSQQLTVELTVEPAAPLPIELGDVTFDPPPTQDCRRDDILELSMALSDDARPFAQLLEVRMRVDGQPPFVVAHYGTLSAEDTISLLRVRRCAGEADVDCIPSRPVEIQLSATIAGETTETESEILTLDASCGIPETKRELTCSASFESTAPRWRHLFCLISALAMVRLRRTTSADAVRREARR